jgi:hypothetical protein
MAHFHHIGVVSEAILVRDKFGLLVGETIDVFRSEVRSRAFDCIDVKRRKHGAGREKPGAIIPVWGTRRKDVLKALMYLIAGQ